MKKTPQYPRLSQDVFVNQKMLFKVRDELKAHMASEIHNVRTDIESLKSDFQSFKADVHRIALLAEEQNNRNKIVLDGLSHLWGRQEKLENHFLEIKK